MADKSKAVAQLPNNWNEILAIARTHQYDRYIAATLSPRLARSDLVVLAAFAGEMRRIPWAVSDPTIGMIRLQWWRDSVDAGGQLSSGNPLADALNDVIVRNQLPTGLLLGQIDAQELELFADPVEDIEQLRLHFIKREAGMFQLAAKVLGAQNAIPEIERGAFAYGMAKTVAEFAFRRNGRQLLIPAETAQAHGVDLKQEQAAGLDPVRSQMTATLEELSDLALSDYQAFRGALGSGSRELVSALLPVALVPSYAQVAKSPFDAANLSHMGPGNFAKTYRMFLAYLRGRI